ncbi:MAG: glycoside hydrolase family 32 protein, partial [Lachnospira sp.]|nr:glycoside hydrolase family 32 protein [Lachnospira sp.]
KSERLTMAITKIKEPAFHITGKTGWINDPNGLIYYNGQYHAFFQHYPHDTRWGPMHWGHVVSNDLTNWEYLPIALTPGDDCDKNGCFSGSAIVHDSKLWLVYTGFIENQGGDSIRQVQCLAESSDGITFKKHGIIIGEGDLPDGYAPCDFRDPKVWLHDDTFWCIIGAKKVDGRGRILLYKSKDLFKWEFVSDLLGTDSAGIMIECPDYNEELGYLLYCEQFQPSENGIHLNVHTCRFCIGKIDYTTGLFKEEARGIVDYGFDVYAPQTFSGKHIIMGWLNMWDRNVPSEKYGFAGMLTAPRRVFIKDGRLYQEPIVNCCKTYETIGRETLQDKVKKGVITINATGLEEFEIKMRSNGANYTTLSLKDGEWVFCRAQSGEVINGVEKDSDSLNGIRRMPYSGKKEITVTIVMDEFSVEIFEDGRALTSTIYPPDDADGLELTVKAESWQYERADINLKV